MDKYRVIHPMTKEIPKTEIQRVLQLKDLDPEVKAILKNLNDDSVKIIKKVQLKQLGMRKRRKNVIQTLQTSSEAYFSIKRPVVQRKKDYLTVKEVAKLFRVSETAVYKWIKENKIEHVEPPIPGGRGYLIPIKQFEGKLLDQRKAALNHKKFIMKQHATDIDLVNRNDLFRS